MIPLPGVDGAGRRVPRMDARGFTLTELIVALMVFEVMLLGAVGLLRLGIQRAGTAERSERVTWEALALADSLSAALGAPGSGGAAVGSGSADRSWGTLRWEGDAVEAVGHDGRILIRVAVPARVPPQVPDSVSEGP